MLYQAAIVFPGQGIQKENMGIDIIDKSNEYKEIINTASNILGYDLLEVIKKKSELLDETRYAQPAIFVVNHICYLDFWNKYHVRPFIFMGHSLGEYNALTSAGILKFEQAIKMVNARGECMNRVCNEDFEMMAVSNLDAEIVDALCSVTTGIFSANYNSPWQTVVAGTSTSLRYFTEKVEKIGGRCTKLNVNGSFHTVYMKEAADEYKNILQTMDMDIGYTDNTVICNLNALPYSLDQEKVIDILYKQIFNPVNWSQQISYIKEEYNVDTIIECSISPILTNMLRKYPGKSNLIFYTENNSKEELIDILEDQMNVVKQKRRVIEKLIRIITCTPSLNENFSSGDKIHENIGNYLKMDDSDIDKTYLIYWVKYMIRILKEKGYKNFESRKQELIKETCILNFLEKEKLDKIWSE